MLTRPIALRRCVLGKALLAASLLMVLAPRLSHAQGVDRRTSQAWTFESAVEQLQLHPRDPYLQYIVLQLGRSSGRAQQAREAVESVVLGQRMRGPGREPVDAFGLFSGALAVQESLQLDRLSGATSGGPSDARGLQAATIPMATLSGPTIRSHPWTEMLNGQQPRVSRLSRSVPADQYFIETPSVGKLLELADQGDLWGRHLMTQGLGAARTQLSVPRLIEQLALDTDDPLRPFYDQFVGRVALTGNDLFFREGTDVTLLFEMREPIAFRARMDLFLAQAQAAHADAVRTEGSYRGVDYVHLETPDRHLHVYSAYLENEVHIRGNSLVGLRRVVDAMRGENELGDAVERLGETDEFRYIRTLMPLEDDREDVLVYLSDPFIRRLVGPQVKLTELRRMHCYNHQRMIAHAGLLYLTQFGRPAASLNQLVEGKCLPAELLNGGFACPDGGRYGLHADGLGGHCSHHGHHESLTPCCEIPLNMVTAEEAAAYKVFLERYNSYWRNFFDPIAVRLQITPEKYRVETIILPLIDNSIYTGMAMAFNGEPQNLEPVRIPRRTIFSAAVRLNKKLMVNAVGANELLVDRGNPQEVEEFEQRQDTVRVATRMRSITQACRNYANRHGSYPPSKRPGETPNDRNAAGAIPPVVERDDRLSWRVHILPFLGGDYEKLYREFHLEEPWDSPHNRELISRIPDVFRPSDEGLANQGRTQIVMPIGKDLLTPEVGVGLTVNAVSDQIWRTVLLVECEPERAVVWTRPADLELELSDPLDGVRIRPDGGFLATVAGGGVDFVRKDIELSRWKAMLTRAGGEDLWLRAEDRISLRLPQPDYGRFSLERELGELEIGRFLLNGIGDQVGFHVYDGDPLVSMSLPMLISEIARDMSRGGRVDDDTLFIGALLASLSSPVYLSVPVQDARIVDRFLERMDKALARLAASSDELGGFIQVEHDFYRWKVRATDRARGYALQIGPLRLRMFWARVGDMLYVTSKPYILEDLLDTPSRAPTASELEVTSAHAMIRMRPENWNQVLHTFQLGWAERHRVACHANLGPMSNLQRASNAATQEEPPRSLEQLAARIYDAHFYCPDGGRFEPSLGGNGMECSIHGSVLEPNQLSHLEGQSAFGQLMRELQQVTLTLTFLEDGLHAVVTIDRDGRRDN